MCRCPCCLSRVALPGWVPGCPWSSSTCPLLCPSDQYWPERDTWTHKVNVLSCMCMPACLWIQLHLVQKEQYNVSFMDKRPSDLIPRPAADSTYLISSLERRTRTHTHWWFQASSGYCVHISDPGAYPQQWEDTNRSSTLLSVMTAFTYT